MLTFLRMLFSSVLILSVFQVNYSDAIEISSYARVSRNGDSISNQSDKGNKSVDLTTTKMSDIDSTLIDKHNKTAQPPPGGREGKQMNDKGSSEKSTGRAIQSNYYFPLTQQLRRPVQSNYNSNFISNDKTGRLIVYPTYSANSPNSIDPTRSRYNMMSSTGQQPAQRRFQYTPDSLYKFKGMNGGYQYSKPPTADISPPAAPAQPAAQAQPVFVAPIVVADTPAPPPKSSYLPPDMMMPSAPGSHFLPTVLPQETSSPNPIIDLLAFPTHINSSYLPAELDAIKHSIDNNHPDAGSEPNDSESDETTNTPLDKLFNFPPNIEAAYLPPEIMAKGKPQISSYLPPPAGDEPDETPEVEETTTPPKKLHNFPPNIESSYLPPEMRVMNKNPISSYLPPPSGDNSESPPADEGSMTYVPPNDLHNFPPNINSMYLPPEMRVVNKNPISSYLPPPSGDNEESPPANEGSMANVSPNDLHNFPPNINSMYLPPGMQMNGQPLINSYLPPPSGDISENPDVPPSEDDEKNTYLPPKDLHNFPPNINSMYLPPEMRVPDIPNNSYLPQASGSEADIPVPSNMYIPQQNLQNFPPNIQASYLPPGMNQVMANVNSYLPPPSGSVSGFSEGSKQNFPGPMAPPPMEMPMQMPMQMPTAPSGPPMDMPPSFDDHDHHHHHHDYSDLSFDYDHHHHHHEEPPPETTTTEAPEEPRVKKYSYYYLGRKLWYVPLYFTLWFCLYVAALIIRSIGRHKVDLPNHYVSRSLHDMSHKETIEKINMMTAFAMNQIEDFKEKYL